MTAVRMDNTESRKEKLSVSPQRQYVSDDVGRTRRGGGDRMSAIKIEKEELPEGNKYRHICIGNVSVGALSNIYSTTHRTRFQGIFSLSKINGAKPICLESLHSA